MLSGLSFCDFFVVCGSKRLAVSWRSMPIHLFSAPICRELIYIHGVGDSSKNEGVDETQFSPPKLIQIMSSNPVFFKSVREDGFDGFYLVTTGSWSWVIWGSLRAWLYGFSGQRAHTMPPFHLKSYGSNDTRNVRLWHSRD